MIPKNLAPLRINAKCVADNPTIRKHVEYCIGLGLKFMVPTDKAHPGEAVLVGSAPSVRDQVSKLKSMRKDPKYRFFGIKGGHDFLLKNKIQPDFGLAVDPLEKIHKENFLLKAKDCKYFIASQCHPTLFDMLIDRGEEVIIWHLATDNLGQWSRDPESPIFQHYMIPGGSTSGLRAIVLAFAMGFRVFHLFGYDSCLSEKLRKVNGEIYDQKKADGSDKAITLVVGGKKFTSDPAMASQANEFQDLLKSLFQKDDPFVVKGYGQGLIQHIIKQRYKEGAPECLL